MLHTFFKKERSKHYTTIKFYHSNNSNGKNLVGLSRDKPILNKTDKSFPFELFEWQNLIVIQRFDCYFLIKINIINVLNVTVMTMLWLKKAKAEQK